MMPGTRATHDQRLRPFLRMLGELHQPRRLVLRGQGDNRLRSLELHPFSMHLTSVTSGAEAEFVVTDGTGHTIAVVSDSYFVCALAT